MIKTRKKWLINILLFAMLISLLCLGLTLSLSAESTTAYAATLPKYTVQFNYKYYTGGRVATAVEKTSENNVYKSQKLDTGRSPSTYLAFYIYGDSNSGTANYTSSTYIGLSKINISVDSNFSSNSFTVKNSSGTTVATSTSKTFSVSSLKTGIYSVEFVGTAEWTVEAGFRNLPRASKVEANFKFAIDVTAPTITGASTSTTGKYANVSFTVNAIDSDSGIDKLYWKDPNASAYSAISGSSKTISSGSASGLYRFYAKDKAGNTSATYYVYYDSSAPTMKFINSTNGKEISNGTKYPFQVSATDSGSGISRFEYKKPGTTTWLTYTQGTIISADSPNGEYSFRVYDKAGNGTARTMILDTGKPIGTLYTGSEKVSNGGTSTATSLTFSATDTLSKITSYYVKKQNSTNFETFVVGTQFAERGLYSFYCVDSVGNQSNIYSFTLMETHVHAYVPKTIAPTCTEGGYTKYVCSCGDSYTDDATDALGHSYQDWQVTKEATCMTSGMLSAKCIRCDSVKTETVKAKGHDFSVIVSSREDTCTTAGSITYKCGRCDETRVLTGTALGHNYQAKTIDATCTEDGYTEHTCSRCGNQYKDKYTDKLGHKYEISAVTATCTKGGGILHKCSRCNDEYISDIVAALGHDYAESVVSATCTSEGYKLHTCRRCEEEYKENVVAPLGHSYVSQVKQSATCTTDGIRSYLCERCGDYDESVIPAMGHNYEIRDTTTDDGVTVRTYICTVCGDSYTQDLGSQYEQVSSYIEYLFKQYQPYMWWVLLACAGVWSIAMGVFFAIATKNEDKEKARKMIKNYVIGLVVIFAILVACPYLVKGIAALIAG